MSALRDRKLEALHPHSRKHEGGQRLDQMAAAQAGREKALEQVRLAQHERAKLVLASPGCSHHTMGVDAPG